MNIKKALKFGLKLYIAAYLGISAHIGYDFFKNNLPKLEETGGLQNQLEIHRYKVNIDGEEKNFTLVGEVHHYNKREFEIAEKLVKEHDYFANECGSGDNFKISIGNFLYGLSVALPLSVSWFYQHLGNGRWYDPIDDIAENYGYTIHALENNDRTFNFLSLGDRIMFFGNCMASAINAPLDYYEAKNEEQYNPDDLNFGRFRDPLIDKRDPLMAKEIVNLLKQDGINNLLVETGRAHTNGIIKHLSKEIKLEEII